MTNDGAVPTSAFDPADYLTDLDDQADLIRDARASGDRAYLAHAVEVVARANRASPKSGEALVPGSVRWAFKGQHPLMRIAA